MSDTLFGHKDNGTVSLFAYDEGGNLIGEYDSLGNAVQEHVWFNGAPVAVLQGTNTHYVHTDHLGTPRTIADGNTVIWRWASDPFGATAAEEDPDGDTNPFTYNLRFPGQYYDVETGLHYNYFRTYDPSTGRYLESDPIGLGGGANTYAYAGGSPTNAVDSLGLYTIVVHNGENYSHGGGNPLGHTAIATTGSGVYSYGNTTEPGSSLRAYIERELGRRDTRVTIIDTTLEQEEAILNVLNSYVGVPLTNEFPGYLKDNCATRVNEALSAAGLPLVTKSPHTPFFRLKPAVLPIEVQMQAEEAMRALGGETIFIPKDSDLSSVLKRLEQFEPECGCEE